jgi:hypothetical protein
MVNNRPFLKVGNFTIFGEAFKGEFAFHRLAITFSHFGGPPNCSTPQMSGIGRRAWDLRQQGP